MTGESADFTLPGGYTHIYSGKVRDLWETPDGQLLFVASDRISAFDVILPTRIPDKGRILTAMSMWWFDRLGGVVPNHVISLDVPTPVTGRAMICQRLDMIPIECVARGYLTGSGLRDYRATGSVGEIPLMPGLDDGSRLPMPIFTPATKAALGEHDENVGFGYVGDLIGDTLANELRRVTLDVYNYAAGIARLRGLILADTKLEFGHDPNSEGGLMLADEVLTPDSSRWWPIEGWNPGAAQKSFDKQFLRDWLTSPDSGWQPGSTEPPPDLPAQIVEQTRDKYVEAYVRLTGIPWSN